MCYSPSEVPGLVRATWFFYPPLSFFVTWSCETAEFLETRTPPLETGVYGDAGSAPAVTLTMINSKDTGGDGFVSTRLDVYCTLEQSDDEASNSSIFIRFTSRTRAEIRVAAVAFCVAPLHGEIIESFFLEHFTHEMYICISRCQGGERGSLQLNVCIMTLAWPLCQMVFSSQTCNGASLSAHRFSLSCE